MHWQQDLHDRVQRWADRHHLAVTADQLNQLETYLVELDKWNRSYNLTAIRQLPQMVTHHVLDSLSIQAFLTPQLLDVGTGPGLPGLVLAVVNPDRLFTLLDSNGKKTRFLRHIQQTLNLQNINIQSVRADAYQPAHLYPAIASRAFSSLVDLVVATRHVLSPQGVYLAMKGQYPEQEIQRLQEQIAIVDLDVYQLDPDGVDGQRHLIRFGLS